MGGAKGMRTSTLCPRCTTCWKRLMRLLLIPARIWQKQDGAMAHVKARELQYEYKAVSYLFYALAWLCEGGEWEIYLGGHYLEFPLCCRPPILRCKQIERYLNAISGGLNIACYVAIPSIMRSCYGNLSKGGFVLPVKWFYLLLKRCTHVLVRVKNVCCSYQLTFNKAEWYNGSCDN